MDIAIAAQRIQYTEHVRQSSPLETMVPLYWKMAPHPVVSWALYLRSLPSASRWLKVFLE
jgi:hypothetical protein